MGRHWADKKNQIIKGMNLTDISINIGEGGAGMDKGQVWTHPFSAKRLFFQLNGWQQRLEVILKLCSTSLIAEFFNW